MVLETVSGVLEHLASLVRGLSAGVVCPEERCAHEEQYAPEGCQETAARRYSAAWRPGCAVGAENALPEFVPAVQLAQLGVPFMPDALSLALKPLAEELARWQAMKRSRRAVYLRHLEAEVEALQAREALATTCARVCVMPLLAPDQRQVWHLMLLRCS